MEFSKFVNDCLDMVTADHTRPLVIGLGGGECTGKTYLADKWQELAGEKVNVIVISLDGYLVLSRMERRRRFNPHSPDVSIRAKHIGDHPSNFDLKQLHNDLESIARKGEWVPRQYDYERGEVVTETSTGKVPPGAIVIVEGIFALHKSLHDVIGIKVFVQTSEDIMRQRYVLRHDERKTKPTQEVIDTFEWSVLPAYRKFIAPSAEYAEYIMHNCDSTTKVRKLSYATQRITKRETTPPGPGRYRVFITHNLDNASDFMMDIIREVANDACFEVTQSTPGGAATSPAEDVRMKISEAEALLAVIGKDTNWVSNEIGMAYALHLPIYAIHHSGCIINGVTKMITSMKATDIYIADELRKTCKAAFNVLKKEIQRQRNKLPEKPHPGSTIIRIGWQKYYEMVQEAHRSINILDPDPIQGGYAPTLLLGISRGGIIAADTISRIGGDLPLGLLEAKRREEGGKVFFEEEPLRALLKAHCISVKHEVRILVIDDVLKSGTSLVSALRVVERIMSLFDPVIVSEFTICSLVLILQGDPNNKQYVPDYFIEQVEEGTSIILPYGRG